MHLAAARNRPLLLGDRQRSEPLDDLDLLEPGVQLAKERERGLVRLVRRVDPLHADDAVEAGLPASTGGLELWVPERPEEPVELQRGWPSAQAS
mgnify:CR=1 FL=1